MKVRFYFRREARSSQSKVPRLCLCGSSESLLDFLRLLRASTRRRHQSSNQLEECGIDFPLIPNLSPAPAWPAVLLRSTLATIVRSSLQRTAAACCPRPDQKRESRLFHNMSTPRLRRISFDFLLLLIIPPLAMPRVRDASSSQ